MDESLFGRVAQGFVAVVNHCAHLADALGALGLALVMAEHLGRTARAGVDRRTHLTFPKPIAIADVQDAFPTTDWTIPT